jgi:hypothetical protein
VFVTGRSQGTNAVDDFATVAYSNGGTPLWTNRYSRVSNGADAATCIAADAAGHIFVGGYSFDTVSGYDFVLILYSTSGVPLCTNRYNGPANGSDQPLTRQSIALTPGGAVLVGASDGDFTSGAIYDYAVVKYLFPAPNVSLGSPSVSGASVTLPGFGTPNTAWQIQAAPAIIGPWSGLGMMFLGPNGLGEFTSNGSPTTFGFYRALWLP